MCDTAGIKPFHAPGSYGALRLTMQIRLSPRKGMCVVNKLDTTQLVRMEKVNARDASIARFLPSRG